MLALPMFNGGLDPKRYLVSIGCAKSPWQNECKYDYCQPF